MNRMTPEEARKIMGDDAPDITDEELEITIGHLEALATETIRSIMNGEIKLSNKDTENQDGV
jgi:hypothetical protein